MDEVKPTEVTAPEVTHMGSGCGESSIPERITSLIEYDKHCGEEGQPTNGSEEPLSHGWSRQWKGKGKATDSPELMKYTGSSPSELAAFVKYCEAERPDDKENARIEFALEHLARAPLWAWYQHRRNHLKGIYTWLDFVQVLRDSATGISEHHNPAADSNTSFHKNQMPESSASTTNPADPYDIIDFLAVLQDRRLDILPIRWDTELEAQAGGTASVLQGVSVKRNDGQQLSFVFKRVHRETSKEVDRHKEYRALLSEVHILGHPVVRHHPNIISLEGIRWDTVHDEAWPVLVFKRSSYGDLKQFMKLPDGRGLTFEQRIKLCREIGNAIILMHSCHAVHGDIKPENILIFKDVDDEFSAKVADFGYSTLFAKDSESAEVTLPLSWPWTAPEIEDCNIVTFEQAKQADVFSFGLVCFWIICYETLPPSQTRSNAGPNLHLIWEMKQQKDLASLVYVQVRDSIGDNNDEMERGLALRLLFNTSLSLDREKRELHIESLSVPFGYYQEPLPLIEEYGKSVSKLSNPGFDLVGMFAQFRAAGRPTWNTVFKGLENRAFNSPDPAAQASAAYQLAFCYRVGFGAPIEPKQSQFWLERSSRPQEDLESAIEMIRDDTSSIFKNIMANADYFDEERPTRARNRDSTENLDTDGKTSATNQVQSQQQPDVYLLASTAAWIHKSLGIEPGDVRMSIIPEGEEDTKARLDELCKNQFGWEGGGQSTTTIEFTLGADDFFEAFPLEKSIESNESEIDPNDPEEKERRLIRSMERKRKVLGPEHDDTLRDMEALSQFYVQQHRPDEAEPFEIHVMNTRREKLGVPHPATLRTMEKVSGLCMLRDSWEEASVILLEVLDIRKKVSGWKDPSTLKTLEALDYLVQQYCSDDMREDAAALTDRLLKARTEAFGDDNEETLETMQRLALLYGTMDHKRTEGEKLFAHIIRQRKRSLGHSHPRTIEAMQILAGFHAMHSGDSSSLVRAHQLQTEIENAKSRPSRPGPASSSRNGDSDNFDNICEHRRDYISSVDSMGQAISQFLAESLDKTHLDDQIRGAEDALGELDDESTDRHSVLAKLSEGYMQRFRQHNDGEDLAQAIIWAEQAAIVLSDDDAHKALRLEELATLYWIRFELAKFREPDDLENSIKYTEESVTTTLDGDPDLAGRLGDLALRLRKRYEETLEDRGIDSDALETPADTLDLAILWAEQAVQAVSDADSRRFWWLILLGQWYEDKYEMSFSQSGDDLNQAIDALDSAEALMTEDQDRAQLYDKQANLYEERFFNHSQAPEDLNESIRKSELAVEAAKLLGSDGGTLVGGETPYGPLLSLLAFRCSHRFQLCRFPEDLTKATAAIDTATQIVPPESRSREMTLKVRGIVHGLQQQALESQ
ncbi:hypothetical protein HD806DRAFT_497980 [Xylariaceae sp. AK1471]|nr:hypothetical protein HD806DRAFT_497980 [Xylariaceae sp. AK1471]